MSLTTDNNAAALVAENQAPITPPQQRSAVFDAARDAWELLQRQAKAYSSSPLAPKDYQGPNGMGSCIIALDIAQRLNMPPLMVMQNMYVVQGRPSWSSTFLVSCVNACGRFTALRYEERGTPGADDFAVRAWAEEKRTGERLNGTWITWDMVKAEGWLNKSGSKWKTMPEQMSKYRAAAFWCRAYAPEIAMGFHTADEVEDIADTTRPVPPGTMTVRLSPKQMKEAQYEVEAMGKTTAAEIIERNPNLPDDQKLLIATWEYKDSEA